MGRATRDTPNKLTQPITAFSGRDAVQYLIGHACLYCLAVCLSVCLSFWCCMLFGCVSDGSGELSFEEFMPWMASIQREYNQENALKGKKHTAFVATAEHRTHNRRQSEQVGDVYEIYGCVMVSPQIVIRHLTCKYSSQSATCTPPHAA